MENKIEYGDYVEISTGKKSFEGMFLEPPESEKGIYLLKLDNGYNIGFNKKEITRLELLEKKEKDEIKKKAKLILKKNQK